MRRFEIGGDKDISPPRGLVNEKSRVRKSRCAGLSEDLDLHTILEREGRIGSISGNRDTDLVSLFNQTVGDGDDDTNASGEIETG